MFSKRHTHGDKIGNNNFSQIHLKSSFEDNLKIILCFKEKSATNMIYTPLAQNNHYDSLKSYQIKKMIFALLKN